MAYTWKDGELITAEKLNNTGGSGELTVVNANLIEDWDEDTGTGEIYVDLDMSKDKIEDKLLANNNVVIHFGNDSQTNGRFANSVCHLTKISIPSSETQIVTTEFTTFVNMLDPETLKWNSHILVIDNLYDVYIVKLSSEPGYK